MKTYAKAPDAVSKIVTAMIEKYHPELKIEGVRIDCISAASDDPDSPAVTLHGYPCSAIVKILDSKQRAMGRGDAEIVIDEARFKDLKVGQQNALIDHELYHLAVKKNKYGRTKLDEHGRPKLKMRKHDREYGWFDEIAHRHGSDSQECMQATQLYLSGKQVYFEFALKMKLGDGVKATVKLMP